MHILIITSERYLPRENPLAGIFQHDQAHALKRAGFKVGIIAPKSKSLLLLKKSINNLTTGIEFNNDRGIPVYRYQGWRWLPDRFSVPYVPAWINLKIGRKMFEKYINEQGVPDIVHAHNTLYAGIIALLIKKKYNIPYVLTEHSSLYLRNNVYKWQMPIVKNVLKSAAERLVVSRYLGEVLERQFGKVTCPWIYVPNILNEYFEKKIFPKKGLNTNSSITFLNVASLVKVKNHEGLLNAFAYKFKGKDFIKLRIGGNGPLLKKLKGMTRELGIENQVVFLGLLNRQQVFNEMHSCDYFVLSSYHETFGVVLIEALSCGTPVVATACGGPEGIIHEKNGILVPPRNNVALAEAMVKIIKLNKFYDRELIRRDCINEFGEKAIVNNLKNIYQRVLSN